jgi:beta-lactam-binding protein with PASTA domain/predicted Ser/Thr protein kinase
MADVFLARDVLLDRPVAVKVLFPQFAAEPTFVERFRREAQAAANLNHPSIVAVYDWGKHDNTYFIVMEYVDGRSLADILRAEGTLHPDRAAEICTDAVAALGFAHRNGTVHRDVKPGNILITPDGQVKVTDFGIARAFGGGDELTQTGSVMGTATYFSPEQAQGKNVDPRSDLYSLGIVLFEMVTGRPPFVGDSPVAIAYKHVQEAPPRPTSLNPSIPKPLESVIARLLAKNPTHRYPSAEEVRTDLRRFRQGEPLMSASGGIPPAATAAAAVGAAAASTGQQRAVIDTTRAIPAAQAAYHEPAEEEYYEPPRRNGVFFAMLAILLLALAGIVFFIASALDGGDTDEAIETEVVPLVVGMEQDEAVRELERAGFEADPTFEENAGIEPGIVFEQTPTQNSEAPVGSTVQIKVSQSDETVTLPDVRGLQEVDAVARLESIGLRVDRTLEASDEFDAGIVIGMTPEPNQDVNSDALITLKISTGPAAVNVPNTAGLTLEAATSLLEQFDLPAPQFRPEASSEVAEGLVIRSDPEAGTEVSIDRQVILYISSGPETELVPSVVGLTQQAAEQAISNKGFIPVFEAQDVAAGSPDAGKVISQDPPAGEDLELGSDVTIRVGVEVPATTTSSTTTTTTQPTTSSTASTTSSTES